MKNADWTLDHIGHAVEDLEAAVEFYTKVLGFSEQCRERIEEQGVDVVFVVSQGACIELLAPISENDTAGNNTLRNFLDSKGEGIHHICYEVASIGEQLKRLTAEGVRLVDSTPRAGSRDSQIAFIHPKSTYGVLIELCSYE